MNQVLVFEPNEITAFGVFKIDLNLAVTVSIPTDNTYIK